MSAEPDRMNSGQEVDSSWLTISRFRPESQDFEILSTLLKHPRWEVRWNAARELYHLKDARAVDTLIDLLKNDPSESVRAMAGKALGALRENGVKIPLYQPTDDLDEEARVKVVLARLRELGVKVTVEEDRYDLLIPHKLLSSVCIEIGYLIAQFVDEPFPQKYSPIIEDIPSLALPYRSNSRVVFHESYPHGMRFFVYHRSDYGQPVLASEAANASIEPPATPSDKVDFSDREQQSGSTTKSFDEELKRQIKQELLQAIAYFIERQHLVAQAMIEMGLDLEEVGKYGAVAWISSSGVDASELDQLDDSATDQRTREMIEVMRRAQERQLSQKGTWRDKDDSEWIYSLHGAGCSLINPLTTETIDCDCPNVLAFDLYFFFRHLEWQLISPERKDKLQHIRQWLQQSPVSGVHALVVEALIAEMREEGLINADWTLPGR